MLTNVRAFHSFVFVCVAGLMALAFVRNVPLHGGDETEMPPSARTELYVEFLKQEGYLPKVDKDGDVFFKREGFNFFIAVDEKDPCFFQLVLPGLWEIESAAEKEKVQDSINHANLETKTAKGYIVGGKVWVSVEIFVESPEDFRPVFSRCVNSLASWAKKYVDKME
jgi:hypothetical protein